MDQNLKHRLTGAIILVSVAVIFIPVILEGPDNEWAPLSHSVPEAPQLEFKARLEVPQPVGVPAPVRRTKRFTQKAAVAEKKKSVTRTPQETTSVKQEMVTTPGLKGWYVQVGSFSQELNASGLGKRLQQAGYKFRLQKVATETGYAWRVMVGPGKSRSEAGKLRKRLAKERQLKGIVIHNPG